ncbi:hypothetical protein BD414DRAFT_422849 [Trametes punicea]|nr:hypothetical protein BD414DRAFT_422849 [Trametes punicea]
MSAPWPQEVVYRIIEAIDDRDTLRSCALVCRQWLPASRYHLFQRILIASHSSFETLVQVRDAPHIAPAYENVRSLQLRDDKERPWLHLFPLLLFPDRFPRLFFLTMGQFAWDKHPLPRTFLHSCTQFRAVTTLNLSDGIFYSFAEFRRLVGAFKQLRRLFVDNVGWRYSSQHPAGSSPSTSPRLQLLWFIPACTGAVPALVDWLLSSASVESLTDLQIRESDGHDLPEIQRLTRILGPHLEHFQVSLRFWTQDRCSDLSYNTFLRTLHVRDVEASSCRFVAPFLDRLMPRELVHITFHLHLHSLRELKVVEGVWSDVADILSRDDFLPLQMLAVWVHSAPPAEEIPLADLQARIRSWMPILDARTFLHVSPWYTLVT